MALREVRKVPDPALRQTCMPITRFDGALQDLTDDMLATMYAANGRGLAAPQVGEAVRVFVMDEGWKTGEPCPQVFVNPVIVAASKTLATMDEGCLSIPDRLVAVSRPHRVRLRWQDRQGNAAEMDFSGFAAVCVQHEIDHLNGVLITDKRP